MGILRSPPSAPGSAAASQAARAGWPRRALWACALAAALAGCQREFESPFLPGSGEYAGSEWTRDSNGDGVADSVAKYAPSCDQGPDACMRLAREAAGFKPVPNPDPIPGPQPSSIKVEEMELDIGEAKEPEVEIRPDEAADKRFELVSENPAVAEIRGGLVAGVAKGSTQITVRALANGKTARFKVKVTSRLIDVDAGDVELQVGAPPVAPPLSFTPADAATGDYRVSGGDAGIAVASADGRRVEPVGPGLTFFTLSVEGFTYDVFAALVLPHVVHVVSVRAEDMTFSLIRLGHAAAQRPAVTWEPEDATDKGYLLFSENPLVARSLGETVEPGLPGETKVTLYSNDGGKAATFNVKVELLGSDGTQGKGEKGKGKSEA